jgi:dipeptidyl aminopeptidase/acylaminoacyl peptidase
MFWCVKGGYATALALAMDYNNPVFSCGISVAPVTSWLLYGE